jgi:hypothetical protein
MKVPTQRKTSRFSADQNRLPLLQVCLPEAAPVQYRLPPRIWLEIVAGLMSAALLMLAILLPDWMEVLFGFAPDAGDGSAERGIALFWVTITVLMFGLAGRTWRKHVRLLRSV